MYLQIIFIKCKQNLLYKQYTYYKAYKDDTEFKTEITERRKPSFPKE